MTRLLVLVVVAVLIAGVAAEVVVPPRIEEAIERRVTEEVPEAGVVRAELDSFPVVARGLGTGEVERLVVTLQNVSLPEVEIESVQVEMTGIDVARRALFDGELDLQRIDQGRLTAVVTEAALEEATPGHVGELALTPGRAEVTVARQTVGSDVTVSEGRVRFDLGFLPDASVDLPGREFFPCDLQGEVVEGAVLLRCTLERVPDYLLRRLDGG
ncbi:MAG TPA: hypothetical protein VGV93_11870 [Acidimicrobiales bacterium]|nr:hypothetical protein [Acidimicrobiales bacterium]